MSARWDREAGPRDPFEPVDDEVVGCEGVVRVRIPGGEQPGEVRVWVRGTQELFLAYAEDPLAVGRPILVFSSRGRRAVDVMPDPRQV